MEKKIVRFIFQFQYEFYYIIMLQKETLGSYTLFDTIIANQYSYPIAFTPGYEHTKWTDKKSKPARFVFLPPYIIFAETARKMEKQNQYANY